MVALFLDLETIPVQDQDLINFLNGELANDFVAELAAVKAPANYKDPKKIADFVEETTAKLRADQAARIEESYTKTSLDGGLGQICTVAWAVEDDKVQTIQAGGLGKSAEYDIIIGLFGELEQFEGISPPTLVGHNMIGFDLGFLRKRAIIHGLRPPRWLPHMPKAWETDRVYDTMVQWAGLKGYIKLTRLARLLGVHDVGPDIDGSMVWSLMKAGEYNQVAAHCRRDVELVRRVYRRMNFEHPITKAGAEAAILADLRDAK